MLVVSVLLLDYAYIFSIIIGRMNFGILEYIIYSSIVCFQSLGNRLEITKPT